MLESQLFIEKLTKYKPEMLKATPEQAAVMLLLLENETGPMDIVLTKRSDTLSTYAGHYSFPGGMRDMGDSDLYATAERETLEELNIMAHDYQYLGQLDDFIDRYDNLVRPFVTIMKKAEFIKNYNESSEEISGVYYFSLAKLNRIKDEPKLHTITRRRPSYAFSEESVFVWGLTATILVHFYNVIAEKNLPLGKSNQLSK